MPRLEELGKKFKLVESQFEKKLNPFNHTIIRIDGHKFHKYTKKFFTFPFDIRISLALFESSKYIVERLSKVIVFFYIQSDEISFYIPSCEYFLEIKGWQDVPNIYNYRIQKIISLLSSFVTAKFNENIIEITNNDYVIYTQQKILCEFNFKNLKYKWELPTYPACFDCRIFQLNKIEDVNEYFTWRRIDAIRNSKNQFSYGFLSHKETLKLSSNKRIKLVKERFNADYYKLPTMFKVGLPVKVDNDLNNDFGFYQSSLFSYNKPSY